jgi:hypothetical protein
MQIYDEKRLHSVRGRFRGSPRKQNKSSRYAPVAQLDRASDYESEGQEFESLRVRHFFLQFQYVKNDISSAPAVVAWYCHVSLAQAIDEIFRRHLGESSQWTILFPISLLIP